MTVSNQEIKLVNVLSSDKGQKLCWWTQKYLTEIATKYQDLLNNFSRDWFAFFPEHPVVICTIASEVETEANTNNGFWKKIEGNMGKILWINYQKNYLQKFQAAMFSISGDDSVGSQTSKSGIGEKLTSAAWENFLSKSLNFFLLEATESSEISPTADIYKIWSGAVQVEICWSNQKIKFLLNKPCVQGLLQTQPNSEVIKSKHDRVQSPTQLTSILEAIAHKKMMIRAELTSCTLDFASLQQIQLGDVIPLSHNLDVPLNIKLPDGSQFCLGYLGKKSGNKAIEVMKNDLLSTN